MVLHRQQWGTHHSHGGGGGEGKGFKILDYETLSKPSATTAWRTVHKGNLIKKYFAHRPK